MEEMGITIEPDENGIRVIADKPLKSVDVKTLPYPGFPTDMQSQMMALLLVSEGTSVVTETVFENRFMHVDEFQLMNAEIKVEDVLRSLRAELSLRSQSNRNGSACRAP